MNKNETRPLRKKLWMRWFFDVSKMKESNFFKSDLSDPSPPQIFDAHVLKNTNLSLFSLNFSVGFYIKNKFSKFYSLFEQMRLKRKKTMMNFAH